MQSGYTDANGGSGWGGRTLDGLQAYNSASNFPVSVAMNSPALFCAGNAVQGNSLQPGNALDQGGLTAYPDTAVQARVAARLFLCADLGRVGSVRRSRSIIRRDGLPAAFVPGSNLAPISTLRALSGTMSRPKQPAACPELQI
jgi:hypothetical protein